jgi:hypothetical protein
MSSDNGALELIKVYAPQPNTCVFHLDELGPRIVDFVNDGTLLNDSDRRPCQERSHRL